MIHHRLARAMSSFAPFIVLLSVALLLAACAPAVTSDRPCYVDRTTSNADDPNVVTRITVANVGRWCSLVSSLNRGTKAVAINPAVLVPPQHGQARVRVIQGQSNVEYLPAPGYAGNDEFKVQRDFRGGAMVVHVQVLPGGQTPQAFQPVLNQAPQPPSLQPAARLAADAAIRPLQGPMVFRCPQQGTVQTYASGGYVRWLGADPANGDVCIGRNQAGRPISRIRGIWDAGGFWPDSLPTIRQAGTRLYTGPPGEPVSFTATGATGNAADPRPGTWNITMRVLGQEDLSGPAGTFRTYVVEHDAKNTLWCEPLAVSDVDRSGQRRLLA